MIFQDKYYKHYCIECGKKYPKYKWCRPCQINNLRKKFENWTSLNEKINIFIQGMQLQIRFYDEIVFEWIPYNQFDNIEEISKYDDLFAVYSAKWKDGPLKYSANEKKYKRKPNREISL